MRLLRPWLALVLAGVLSMETAPWLHAQESATGTPDTSSGTGGGSPATTFGSGTFTPSGSGSSSSFGFGAGASSSPAAASSFGTTTPSSSFSVPPLVTQPGIPPANTATPATPGTNPYGLNPPNTPPPPSSVFTGGTTEPTTHRDAPVFSIPAAYGQVSQTLVGGQGRLARPRFAVSGSTSVGYDDNVLSTPYNALGVPEVTAEEETAAAVPAHFIVVSPPLVNGRPVAQANRGRPQAVLVPTVPAKFQTVVLQPAIAAAKPIGSFAARANANAEVQFVSRRTVFTMDFTIGDTYYANRPGDANQYNGSLGILYSHRISPRMDFSATAGFAYLNQPNLSLVNAPTQNSGDYLNVSTKYNLTYRWSPRFSTVSSLSINTQLFAKSAQSSGNFYETLIGTEARYLWMPRLTVLGELRYGRTFYTTANNNNSNSIFLLVGGETTLSRKLTASVHAGGELRDNSAGEKFTPYGETSVSYRYSRTGFVSWTTRLGFEETGGPTQTAEVFRSSVNASQAFSVRTRGTLGFSGVHRITTDDVANKITTENSFQIDVGLEYTLTRHCTLTANYSFTNNLTSVAGSDYFRDQIFLGAQYAF